MRYLLDTNACIALLNKTSPQLLKRVREFSRVEGLDSEDWSKTGAGR